VPKRVLPNWMVRTAALFDRTARQIVPDLDQDRRASNAKARSVLGWEPRSNDEAILATAESLIALEK
jgi:nucleoside-diphosphate-sugar epimerase